MEFRDHYPVSLMCRVLKVIKSGYYKWLRNCEKRSGRSLLPVKIKEILAEYPDNDNYGVGRIKTTFLQHSIDVNVYNIYRITGKWFYP
jgi:hypothetical protein